MNLAKFSTLLLVLFLVSCQLKPETPIVKPKDFDQKTYQESLQIERSKHKVPKKDSTVLTKLDSTQNHSKVENYYTETTDTIQLKIVQGKVKMDTVKQPRQRLIFVLNTDTANKLTLKITPQDSVANVRISQIVDSKGNSDGPFGQETTYSIIEKGIHFISVSESQMQGDAWGGRILFEAKLGW